VWPQLKVRPLLRERVHLWSPLAKIWPAQPLVWRWL
jgi:hypothetical protein